MSDQNQNRKRLGDVLIEKGLITESQLETVILEQQKTKQALGAILLRDKLVEEEELLKILSDQFKMPYVKLQDEEIDWQIAMDFSPSIVVDNECVPLRADDDSITVAINNPLDAWTLSKAQEEAEPRTLKVVLISQADMQDAVREYRQQVRMSWL